jgi:DNA modification methylase
MSEYETFLSRKETSIGSVGVEIPLDAINPIIFPFQRKLVQWAVRKGRCAIFADTGLGKTFMQLEWARLIGVSTIIVAPLSVARQTVREGTKLGLQVQYIRHAGEVDPDADVWITNYEMADEIDFSRFGAVVLDESSILKAIASKTRQRLNKLCANIPYRLACTATPAPNDITELGNHAEFLGICTQAEMLAMFFVNANKEHTYFVNGNAYRRKGTNKAGTEWRLKHHAEQPFYRWLSSWAISMTLPSDLGFEDDGFILPPLNIIPHVTHAEYHNDEHLFFAGLHGISDRAQIRRETSGARIDDLREIVAGDEGQWIIWCGLDVESHAAAKSLPGSIEVHGSDSAEEKAQAIEDFQDGKFQIMVIKPKIGGFGLNLQCAHNMVFMGLNDSWETWYQCIRREYRFGQTHPVNVHVVISELEQEILANIKRKEAMAIRLRKGLMDSVRTYERGELNMDTPIVEEYEEREDYGESWHALLGDSCKRLLELGDNSVDLSVYSPPFADLYTYTNSPRDLGNSRGAGQFFDHYRFIIREVLRVTKPGRLTCVHTSDIPAMAQKDGYIGIKDFPGDVIRAYQAEGWVFQGRAFVQKNPQAQAIRTKSKALLFVQLRKDSTDSRPALVDQVLLFSKPGDNAVPVNPVANHEIDNELWIEWAHGIWVGIRETDTLQYHAARSGDDEKHICPLQLGVIERCIKLYSNPGETVLTPFMGIGSEAYMAVKLGRRAIGIELKPSYYDVAVQNLRDAEAAQTRVDLFSWAKVQQEAD